MTSLWAVALLAAGPRAAWSDTEVEGRSPGGAYYRIVVPDLWNGDLVIWNHGFSLGEIGPVGDVGPLSDLHLVQGFAVAASSYRLDGWALFRTNGDLRQLVAAFTERFRAPRQIFLYGASLGGAVTASALERGRLGNVVGALTLCGAMAGSRNWDAALDLRLIYDQICSDMPGAAIPGGAEGLPAGSEWTDEDVERAVNACTGVLEPRFRRSRRQQRNLERILELSRIPRQFLVTDMGFATRAMSDLVHDRKKLRGRIGTGNGEVVYGDPEIDATIERVEPRRGAARRLRRHFTPKGRVGQARVISMHTSKDGLVVVENQDAYADVVPPDRLTTVIVSERRPSHCVFSPGEVVAGWEALREWVATGRQPTASDVQETCEDLFLIGEICRIDPDFAVPDIDTRIRPR